VRGLHRTFPPPDPPVYVRPQLKPPCGICSFTMTTFGAHRGADQGGGRSTSGRDLLHLLGGSKSAPPPSIAGLLQLPGLTSSRPGRHTVVSDLLRHFRAGIFFPGPALGFPRPALVGPNQHIYVPALPWPAYIISGRNSHSRAGICQFWPSLAGIRRFWAGTVVSRPAWAGILRNRLGRVVIIWVGRPLLPPGRPNPASPLQPSRPRSRAGTAGLPRPVLSTGQASAGPQPRHRCVSSRPTSWARPRKADPASRLGRASAGCGVFCCARTASRHGVNRPRQQAFWPLQRKKNQLSISRFLFYNICK
jgi:hypothetical protein